MDGSQPTDTTQRFGFLLLPQFSMMCLLSAVEPLRAANGFLGREAYSWHFFSRDGAPVAASNGMTMVAEAGIAEIERFPSMGVVASYDQFAAADDTLYGALRRLNRRGTRIGGFDTGPYILAEAGLLEDRRVTLHWECLDAFREAYPRIDARDTLFEIDGSIFTCSGGTAALDLMLHLIGQQHSQDLALQVAELFIHQEMRHPAAAQRMPADRRAGTTSEALARAAAAMEANLETPLSLAEIAGQCGLSKRQLERLFRKHLRRPPQRHYLTLRLERARQLLRQTDMPVFEIGLACGFASAPYFARAYRRQFGHPPRRERASGA